MCDKNRQHASQVLNFGSESTAAKYVVHRVRVAAITNNGKLS